MHAEVGAAHGVGIGGGVDGATRLAGELVPQTVQVAGPVHGFPAPGSSGTGQAAHFVVKLFQQVFLPGPLQEVEDPIHTSRHVAVHEGLDEGGAIVAARAGQFEETSLDVAQLSLV